MSEQYYSIDDNGWASCNLCGRHVKGHDEAKTEDAVKQHLFDAHNISEASDDHDISPYFIAPDRKGFSPLQSKRFDHASHLPPDRKLRFSGADFNK